MNLNLKVWRQQNSKSKGEFKLYRVENISHEMSFLEMFDVLNEQLIRDGDDPITFDHDCREGICGACSMYINGKPHGPWQANTTCQLHMRAFKDGDTVVVLDSLNYQTTLRLAEVDCPEKSQAFGTKAKQFTSLVFFHRHHFQVSLQFGD